MRSHRFRRVFGVLNHGSDFSFGGRRHRRPKRRRDNTRSLESLEPRIVLAGDVIISEVMSKNDKTLSDEDGSSSDWVEIYNAGKAEADLTGWHLTDQRNDRTKWTLPTTRLEPGETLLVFASGKDRSDPEGELHTNFRIGDNSYLALFQADGRTVADEFDPLPVQYTDVSYGVEQALALREVVSVGDPLRVLMPGNAAEDLPTAEWTSAGYDDGTWESFTSGLGFDDDPNDGDFSPWIDANGDLSAMRGRTASAYVRAEFDLPADSLPTYESMELAMNYDDGFIAYLNGQEVARVSAPADSAWDSTATVEHGGIADERHYSDFSDADDRDDFTLNGDAQWVGNALRLTAPADDQTASAFASQAVGFGSDYTFSASMSFDIHSPGGQFPIGGEGLTFVLQSNDEHILGSGQGGLGLADTGSTFVAIELDSVATGAFDPDDSLASHLGVITDTAGSVERVAVPRFNGDAFFAGQPGPGVNLIYLWVDYDGATNQLDVYLHDAADKPADPTLTTTVDLAEMFDGNPAFAGWTSSTSDHINGHDVLSFDIITGIGEIGRDTEYFDLSQHLDALQTGTNVLAIHGLNIDAADEDLLIVPQLSLNEVVLGETLYFSQPTPASLNSDGSLAPSGPVTFSHDSRAFVDPFVLQISADSPDAVIRYTLDGSLPDDDSMLYTGSINVDGPMRIRARAFEPNRGPGPITTGGYIQLDDSLVNFENNEVFDSNLPVIVLDSFGERAINSDAARLVPSVGLFIDTGDDGRAGLLDDPEYVGRAGVRIRGQSSQSWAKKQYAVEIWEEGNDDSDRLFAYEAEDKNVSLFGLPAESDWVLNGPYADKSQLNNYLSYKWFNDVGLYAPRTRLVEVFVNDSRDPAKLNYETHYRGTYVLTEKIKIDKNRVDIAKLEPGDDQEPEITGGYIWKKDKRSNENSRNETPWRTSENQELRLVDPSDQWTRGGPEPGPGIVTDVQKQWLIDHINEFESVLYGANFADPDEGYAKYIDVGSWVDTWLLVEMTKNIDGFRLSTYYHKDLGGKITQGPAWDFNLSLGNANYLRGAFFDGWYGESISNEQYPYWGRLFEDPNFEQAVADRWHELREDTLSTERLLQDVDDAVNLLSDGNPNLENPRAGEPSNPIARNFQRWTGRTYGTDRFHWPNCFFGEGTCPRSPLPGNGRPDSYDDYIFIQKWFIEGRTAWMDSQFEPPVQISPEGGVVDKGTQVSMTAPGRFDIVYTTDGSDPRQPVIVEEETTVLDTGSGVQVTIPSDGNLMDQCDDGLFLSTDDVCFINPQYTTGALGETWTDATTPIGYDTDDQYDALLGSDIEGLMRGVNSSAYVRVPLNMDPIVKDNTDKLTLSVRYDDGFIAYIWRGPLKSPAELLRVNAPGDAKFSPITPLSFDAVAAGTHPDEEAIIYEEFDLTNRTSMFRDGENVLVFHLLNENASSNDFLFDVKLTASTSRVVVSPSVQTYSGPITIDQNTQIVARGFDEIREEWTGVSRVNYVVDSPTVVITELNYNPYDPTAAELQAMPGVDSNDFEFIEIQNVGGSTVDLIGSYFTGLDFTFSSATLNPGEFGVVVRDNDAFRLRYGDTVNVLGEFAEGGLNNGGERIALFDAADRNVFDLTYDDNRLWPERADGRGASLQLVDPVFTPGSEANKYFHWEGSTEFGGSPGAQGAYPIGVVINEVLSHTDPPVQLTDSIELLNTTDAPIDIGGWYLSDAAGDLLKYSIPGNTILGPGDYVVFDESHFNTNPLDPKNFALSGTNGDDVWLIIADADGKVESFVDDVHFRATRNGVSLGRVPDGEGRLTPTANVTLGRANSEPLFGPVLITEVNYNPDEPTAADLAIDPTLSSGDLEFIEIYNTSNITVDLTDWRIRGGVDYNFFPNEQLASGEALVLVRFNPADPDNANRLAAFRNHYGIDDRVRILGGYAQQLSGDGERVTLLSTDTSQVNIVFPRVQHDEVVYDNMLPWPANADNTGNSIHRASAAAYGNDPTSWFANTPTPGTANLGIRLGDFNGDGAVDGVDIGLLFEQLRSPNPDLTFDLTSDGVVNQADRDELIVDVMGTTYGDANLDSVFDSGDLVAVFVAGEYEDGVPMNSTWGSGDWDGDGDFTTSDLVVAFAAGGYTPEATPIVPSEFDQGLPSRQIISALEADRILNVERHELVDEIMNSEPLIPIESAELLLDDAAFVPRNRGSFDAIEQDHDDELDADHMDELIEDLVRV